MNTLIGLLICTSCMICEFFLLIDVLELFFIPLSTEYREKNIMNNIIKKTYPVLLPISLLVYGFNFFYICESNYFNFFTILLFIVFLFLIIINNKKYVQILSKEKELREKELREKELREKELREKESILLYYYIEKFTDYVENRTILTEKEIINKIKSVIGTDFTKNDFDKYFLLIPRKDYTNFKRKMRDNDLLKECFFKKFWPVNGLEQKAKIAKRKKELAEKEKEKEKNKQMIEKLFNKELTEESNEEQTSDNSLCKKLNDEINLIKK